MKISTRLASASFVAVLALSAAAFAQTPAATPAKPMTPPPAAAAPMAAKPMAAPAAGAMDKDALSKSCSAKADAQNLHGKERKKFRSQCKAGKA